MRLNVLDADQGELASHFARRQPDKFAGITTHSGAFGSPLLSAALAHLECRVVEAVPAATHTVFLAEVQAANARRGSPLAYFRGTFGRLERSLDEAVYSELRERVLTRRLAGGGAAGGRRPRL